jgi:hypothetical protein
MKLEASEVADENREWIYLAQDTYEWQAVLNTEMSLRFPCKTGQLLVTSGFRRDADEICALLEYNTASSGNTLPTFRDNVAVPSSRVKKSKNSSWTS